MTRLRAWIVPAVACLVVGAAGWASRATLDEVIVHGVRQRVALVPSWQVLVAFTALAAMAMAGLTAWTTRHRSRRPTPLVALIAPVFALVLLLVPYLPVVPDWWPALQTTAGPGLAIVWALIGAELVWTWWPELGGLASWWQRRPLATQTVAIWLATAAAAGVGASQLTRTVLFPSGDEPHYLVIAQSLWRDGDLAIENNHARKDYAEYFGKELDPHYLTRGADGEIYSVHPIGMPVLVAPVLALGGYTLVVASFIAMAATAATVMWRWAVALVGATGTPTLAWAAIALSAPFLLNAFTIYPEIPAALAVAVGLVLALRVHAGGPAWQDVVIGLMAGALPWLSTKYAPMSAALVAVAVARRAWPLHASEPRWQVAAALRVVLPYGLSLVSWFAFFYAYWGKPMPSAPYGAMVQTQLANTVFGVPGLLFDQEYGLLAYAPAYLLAGFGFWTMLRRPGPLRRLGLELLVVFAALIGTVGAFRIWWGGSAAPGRPIVSGLLLLLVPLAVQLGTAASGSARRAAQHLLIWTGSALAIVLIVAQGGLLIANDRDGTSALLEWLSPRWPLWTLAPTFIAHEAPRALVDVAVWLAVTLVASSVLRRVVTTSRGVAALAATSVAVAALVGVGVAMRSLPPAMPPLPTIDLAARARLAALDTFDRVSRPLTLTYAPLSLARADDEESRLAVRVTPGLRTSPQPIRVLHNGRFSLPAGRYRTVVTWAARSPLPARAQEALSLQVGRIGAPLTTWTVTPAPGGSWQQEFWLPVDAGFVGFRGSSELERSIAEIRVEAVAVENLGDRTVTPQVLAAAAYGDRLVLFHDDLMYPEVDGFWTTGQRQARVTVACPGGCSSGVTLRVHSGKGPNHLRVSTHGWSQEIDLRSGTSVEVAVPPPPIGSVILLDLATTSGFIPSDVDPAAQDRRYLGVWVEPVTVTKEAS